MTVAADQQLSQCNLGTPHAAGQVFAARAPVVQSTDGAAGTIDRAAAPTVLREANFFTVFVCRSQPHGRRGGGPRVQWSA